jgi:hypothetical protein
MIQFIELFLRIYAISWFITTFEPIKFVLDILPNKLVYNLSKMPFYCQKCASFWITLLFTYDFILSCEVSMLVYWITFFIDPIFKKIKI